MALAQRKLQQRQYMRCSIARLFARIPDEDAETLRAWLADDDVSGQAIADALRDEYGDAPTGQSVNRHRKGRCHCERDDAC